MKNIKYLLPTLLLLACTANLIGIKRKFKQFKKDFTFGRKTTQASFKQAGKQTQQPKEVTGLTGPLWVHH